MGFVAVLLMILGVVPAYVHVLAPKVLRYDKFKLMHFASFWGYLAAVVHMWDHAAKFQTVRSILVAALSSAAAVAFIAQKVFVTCTAFRAAVDVSASEVVADSEARHIVLALKVPGFSYAPGQWGYLKAPKLSAVPHPFTIVPGSSTDREQVRFFMKVGGTGTFTEGLAAAVDAIKRNAPGGGQQSNLVGDQTHDLGLRLEGPYGTPPRMDAASVDAVVFMLGGVGVTPALSLVPRARELHKANRVRLLWSLRSPTLLQRCAPMLAHHLEGSSPSVFIKKGLGQPPGGFPLGAQEGRVDVAGFLEKAAADLAADGATNALLFVCGDPKLASAAKDAAKKTRQSGFAFSVHVEEFHFLPPSPLPQRKAPVNSVHAQQVGK